MSTPPLTLHAIAEAINDGLSLADVRNAYVENIGGGVYAVLGGWAGLTVTINGGRTSVDVDADGPADVLICRDGLGIAARTATTAAEVADLFRTSAAGVQLAAAIAPARDAAYDEAAQHARDLVLHGFLDLTVGQWEAWLVDGADDVPSELEPYAVAVLTALRNADDPDGRGNYLQAVASMTTSALQYFVNRVGKH